MPQRRKGARLWLRPGDAKRAPAWWIKDGGTRRSTGCGADDPQGAERALARYLAEKHARQTVTARVRRIDEVPIADVIVAYWSAASTRVARPAELRTRLRKLTEFFGDRAVNDLSPVLTAEYITTRGSRQAARRELEDLRAAVHHAARHRLISAAVPIELPPPPKKRERWLTRGDLARLVLHCWRYREAQGGPMAGRHTRRHVARFLIVARYTGSRAGAICSASYEQLPGRGWVDLSSGVFYRAADMEVPTAKRKPTISLPAPFLAHLRRWQRTTGATHVIEWNGQPVRSVRKALGRACEAANLPGVSAHTLRHTVITWAFQGAADPWEAKGYFGLTDETVERYAHHHPDHQSTVHKAIGRRG